MPTLLSPEFENDFVSSTVYAIKESAAYRETMFINDAGNENAVLVGWHTETQRWETIVSLPRPFAHLVQRIRAELEARPKAGQ